MANSPPVFDCPLGAPYPQRLPLYREYLDTKRQALLEQHRKGMGGKEICETLSITLDLLIQDIYKHALALYAQQSKTEPPRVSIVATGGYGRMELCPHSDLDILFLYPNTASTPELERFKEIFSHEVLYPLWDLKLDIGHASRNIQECIDAAKEDIQVRIGLLECRHICGSRWLYSCFRRAYYPVAQRHQRRNTLIERLNSIRIEHEKQGGSVFVQEPNVKKSVGGLRDYHNLTWLTMVGLKGYSLKALRKTQFASRQEMQALEKAYRFLLRVRNELHFQDNRRNDVLNLEKQPEVALNLGYREDDIFKRVESFMKDYYTHAHTMYYTCKRIEEHFWELTHPQSLWQKCTQWIKKEKAFDGLVLHKSGKLTPQNKSTFTADPIRLIRVFKYRLEYRARFDASLESQLQEAVHTISPKSLQTPEAYTAFFNLLESPHPIHKTFLKMHESGVLSMLFPEFEGLRCLVQHEHYHRYTADIHTLNTFEFLDRILKHPELENSPYRQALLNTQSPHLLYLILLFHDIGKAEGIRDHAQTSVNITQNILKRMPLDPAKRATLLFVIENHLVMSRFWQRYDIEAPTAIEFFADFIQNETYLHFLYVHTYCDACATAPNLWNDYKDTLHRRLHEKTFQYLRDKEVHSQALDQQKEKLTQALQAAHPEFKTPEIENHIDQFESSYIHHLEAPELAKHLKMLQELKSTKANTPIIDWTADTSNHHWTVTIAAQDEPGLFYKLSGTLNAVGMSILTSRAFTRTDGITLDTFHVHPWNKDHLATAAPEAEFKKILFERLSRKIHLEPLILEQAQKHRHLRIAQERTQLKATIPTEINIHYSDTFDRIILEIEAPDRLGLLFHIGRFLAHNKFNIVFGRIHTENGAAQDTLHITPIEADAKSLDLKQLTEAIKQEANQESFLD